jgi:Raf kinase inhibitor-like YbhB/YbcL family protein
MMKPILALTAVLALTVAALAQNNKFVLQSTEIPSRSTINLEQVFNGFGCIGKNLSPSLTWSGAPSGTKSFALILHDPDAQTGVGGFTHWIVYNIPASVNKLEKGAGVENSKTLPSGAVQAATSFGSASYGGPCPPAGEKPHRYAFTLYALGTEKLELSSGASQAFVGCNINGNAVAKTSFTAFYGR